MKQAPTPSRAQELALPIAVCVIAVVVRLVIALFIVSHYGVVKVYGGFESCRIAASLVTGHGFSSPYGIPSGPTAWLPPVYPFLVALVFKLLGMYSASSLWCLILFNIAFETLTVLLLYRIGMRCFGPMTAFAASLLWAIELGGVAYGVRLWESSLSALLVAAATLFYLRLLDAPPRTRDWVLYGLLWAFAALTNTALVVLMPLPVAVLLYRYGRAAWRPALMGLLVFLCALTPWTVRNYVAFHKVIPVRSNFGPNLWYGNHPGVLGPADQTLNPMKNRDEFLVYQQMGEAQYAASRQRLAVAYIREHPREFLQLTAERIVYFWTASETFTVFWRACLSVLAFVGLAFLCRRSLAEAAPFLSALLLFPVPYYVTHAEIFYRHPIEPLVGLLAAYAAIAAIGLVGAGVPGKTVLREESFVVGKNVE